MTNLQIFSYDAQDIRTILVNDEYWFVARDILKAMESSTTVTAVETLICNDLGEGFVSNQPLKTAGGTQMMLCLSESALTYFVSRSRTEAGKMLNRWIHIEVLPSIRKTGSYSMKPNVPQTYLEALKALVSAEEEKELLRIQNEQLEEEAERLSEAVDELFNYSSIIRIAKFNHCSEKNFNWRVLKAASDAMQIEIKKVPCPRYVTKNLYSHDVWRRAYPGVSLPETTTLTIVN